MHASLRFWPFLRSLRRVDRSPPSAARWVLRLLENLSIGRLVMTLPNGEVRTFGDGRSLTLKHLGADLSTVPTARIVLKNWNVFGASLRRGDVGFAETYLDEDWSTDDLPGLLNLLVANRDRVESALYGSWWGQAVARVRHLMRRNSRAGSRRNIHAHYDLGNAFYALWLDPSMTYSSALFSACSAGASLEDAQRAKYRRAVAQLNVRAGEHVLEVGCGWGGFAHVAAHEQRVRVTGLTLSREQWSYARARLATAELGHLTEVRLQDYRDTHETYDAIVSIEMFEAVGEAYWDEYFTMIARTLKPGGRACVQSITIADTLFERYRQSTDFIQQYVFPGGMLPSPSVFRARAAKAGLRVVEAFSFGPDYATTLYAWRDAFQAQRASLSAQGFNAYFVRLWDFYLCYCAAAFEQGNTDVVQFTLERDASVR